MKSEAKYESWCQSVSLEWKVKEYVCFAMVKRPPGEEANLLLQKELLTLPQVHYFDTSGQIEAIYLTTDYQIKYEN